MKRRVVPCCSDTALPPTRRGTARTLAFGLLALASACSQPQSRARLHVSIDADSQVRRATVDVRARVERQDLVSGGWLLLAEQRFTPHDFDSWPLVFAPTTAETVTGTYQLTATARNEHDAVIAEARVIRKFEHGSSLRLSAHFEDACLMRTELCGQSETCHAGSCVSAETPVDAPPIGVTSDSRRAAAQADAGPESPDAAAPPRTSPVPACVGQGGDHVFCDGDAMRDCSDPLAPPARPCGEHARCVTAASTVRCGCDIGFVDAPGGCRVATECADNGACDPLTRCDVATGTVTCSPCPSGYRGDGRTGCQPLLAALEVHPGRLEPAFSPEVTRYKVIAPLLGVHLELSARAPDGTTLAIDGQPLDQRLPWVTPALPIGKTTLELVVTSSSGVHTAYQLEVERSGGQDALIKASNPDDYDMFGFGLALDGDTLVVGAPNEDSASGGVDHDQANAAAVDSGAAYVFVRANGSWMQQAYLKAETPIAGERFGTSVAVLGDRIAIGACSKDPVAWPTDTTLRGAVYVFSRRDGVWTQSKRIVAPDTSGADLFGYQVHLTPDSMYVTAPYESSQAPRSGALYVFDAMDGTWTQRAKLKASRPTAESGFGSAVALDANTLVVGAFKDSSVAESAGSAYVFEWRDAAWQERQRLQAMTPQRGATFGWSVSVLGDTLVVGAQRWGHFVATPSGEVYVFRRESGSWNQAQLIEAPAPRDSDYFGDTVALLTPSTLLVAASGDSGGVQGDPLADGEAYSGAIYLYALQDRLFVRNTYLKAQTPAWGDGLSAIVAVSGEWVAAGAAYDNRANSGVNPSASDVARSDSGAVYVFH